MNDLISRAVEAVEAMPRRVEKLGGQHTSYVQLAEVVTLLQSLPDASQPEAEPVAWRVRLAGDDPEEWTLHHNAVDYLDRPQFECQPLYTRPTPAPVVPAEGLDALIAAAKTEAEKAMRKFPQPNYVISKVAEEAGEVVKAAIHCAEGRETQENVVSEIRQAMAMLFRLYLEGDQVHGLPPLRAQQPAAPVSGVTVKPGEIERAVWSAMIWAASNNAGFNGVPEYTDRGNSFAEDEARRAAARILAALRSAPPVGARVRPWETRPADPDAMIPATVEVHRGAWAVVIGTNGKPAGWIDTHDLFANQLYRDHILTTPAALLPAGEGE